MFQKYRNYKENEKMKPWHYAILILVYLLWFLLFTSTADAAPQGGPNVDPADPMKGLWPLIYMAQKWLKPLGILHAMYGLFLLGIGDPVGKQKIKTAIMMYIGAYVIPYVFEAIDRAFNGGT